MEWVEKIVGVICNRRIPARVKEGLQNGSETIYVVWFALTKRQEAELEMEFFIGNN